MIVYGKPIAYRIANYSSRKPRLRIQDCQLLWEDAYGYAGRIGNPLCGNGQQQHMLMPTTLKTRIGNPLCRIARFLQTGLAKGLFNMTCNCMCFCGSRAQKGLRELQITDGRATTRFFRLASVLNFELVFIQGPRLQSDCSFLPVYGKPL